MRKVRSKPLKTGGYAQNGEDSNAVEKYMVQLHNCRFSFVSEIFRSVVAASLARDGRTQAGN